MYIRLDACTMRWCNKTYFSVLIPDLERSCLGDPEFDAEKAQFQAKTAQDNGSNLEMS